jgi:hypothetical protein
MRDAIQQAIEAMDMARSAVGPFGVVVTKKLTNAIEALQSLQHSGEPVVPEGYVLVPVELTEEMLCVNTTVEGNSHWHRDVDISKQRLRSLWSDLLSAGKGE